MTTTTTNMNQTLRQTNALAKSLEFQLSVLYPNGPGTGDGLTETEFHEMTRRILSSDRVSPGAAGPIDIQIFREAFLWAVMRWKERDHDHPSVHSGGDEQNSFAVHPTNTGKSFSILDQLLAGANGGEGLTEPPVGFEDIQEATSKHERLQLFQKIKYLEDLQTDWDQMRSVLCQDMTVNLNDRSSWPSPDEYKEDVVLSLMSLHYPKWFREGLESGSDEFASLLYGLCQNLLEVLFTTVDSQRSSSVATTTTSLSDSISNVRPCRDNEQEHQDDHYAQRVVSDLTTKWHIMWVDLMMARRSGRYMTELANELAVGMILLMTEDTTTITTKTTDDLAFHALQTLATKDPYSKWFRFWLSRTLPQDNDRIIHLLVETNLLSTCWARMRQLLERSPNDRQHSNPLYPIQLQALSIFCICLHRLRFNCFPWSCLQDPPMSKRDSTTNLRSSWKLLSENMNNDISARNENPIGAAGLNRLVDQFVDLILFAYEHERNPDWQCVLSDGLDAILWGCKRLDLDFDRRWDRVAEVLEGEDQKICDQNGARFLAKLRNDGILDMI